MIKTAFHKLAQDDEQETFDVASARLQVPVQVCAPTWTLHVDVAEDLVSSSQLGLGPASLLSLHVGL